MFKSLKRKAETAVAVEEKKSVRVHWDQYLHMFIVRDVEKDTNLQPCFSVIDLLDQIRVNRYKIVDPKQTRESMNQIFSPKDQTFFHLNHANGIDFSRLVQYS